MDIPADIMFIGLFLRAFLLFSFVQVLTSQSTMSFLDHISSTEAISQTPQHICSQEPPSCPPPVNVSHGSFKLRVSLDCDQYLTLQCDPGYTGTVDIVFCVNNNWIPPIEQGDTLCAASCRKPPNVDFAEVFLLPKSSGIIHVVNNSAGATYEHETEIIYQCLYYDNSSSRSSLQRSRCINGHWEPPPNLECPANGNECQGEVAGLIVLGVFVGFETILLIAIFLFCLRRKCFSDKDDTRMAVPNKKHSGNTYSGQRQSASNVSVEDTPIYPPPRPPARTDTAVVGRRTDESNYYSYADVPVENGNDAKTQNINGDGTSGPGVQRNKSIPQYLEIIN